MAWESTHVSARLLELLRLLFLLWLELLPIWTFPPRRPRANGRVSLSSGVFRGSRQVTGTGDASLLCLPADTGLRPHRNRTLWCNKGLLLMSRAGCSQEKAARLSRVGVRHGPRRFRGVACPCQNLWLVRFSSLYLPHWGECTYFPLPKHTSTSPRWEKVMIPEAEPFFFVGRNNQASASKSCCGSKPKHSVLCDWRGNEHNLFRFSLVLNLSGLFLIMIFTNVPRFQYFLLKVDVGQSSCGTCCKSVPSTPLRRRGSWFQTSIR